ncbi:MAG: hypothetical protein ACK5XV_05870 [Flavobacteriales bacterium]|jgi:exopolyphosphatase/guanosine-5'-triphosphate,3'-diphosphate pyrophosphatase
MRIAIIDCGSNTFNLLIAEADRAGWKAIFRNKLPVRLGTGGYEGGRILDARFIRGLDALLTFRHTMDNYGVQKVYAYATSAIRDAENGPEFVHRARHLAAIEVDVIDGDREAELIFGGVSLAWPMEDQPLLVMDIGGGSTELIIGHAGGILWKRSYQLGVSRLHDQIKPGERMDHEAVNALYRILDAQMGDLREAIRTYGCQTLVGSSGSFDTLLDLFRHAAEDVDTSQKPGLCNDIPLSAFPAIHAWLMGSTTDERLRHPAIPAVRAELMPISSLLVRYILELGEFRKLAQCQYALKEGAMEELWASHDWSSEEVTGERPEDFLEG